MKESSILGPRLVIPGVMVGCTIVAAFLFIVTAHASYPALPDRSLVGKMLQSSNGFAQTSAPPAVEAVLQGGQAEDLYAQEGASNADCRVSASFPASVLQWCELITHHAEKRGLSPDLIAALILQESGGDPSAYSRSGAVGLMQVMPRDGLAATFTCINGPCFSDRPTSKELRDPEFNIAFGTRMLANLLSRYGDLREALKSYGPMNVGYYYADKVLGLLQTYRSASGETK